MFKIGDIVYASNIDVEYEKEFCPRPREYVFGTVVEVTTYNDGETTVCVDFGDGNWYYNDYELSPANDLKDMTLEEFSNKFGVFVNGMFI